jgi:hypothetical protein
MTITHVVTDFDNTATEEKGLEPFFEAYSGKFCEETGMPVQIYERELARVIEDMTREPLKYGWRHNGFFSAPVTGDPIGTNTVAHMELMKRVLHGKIVDFPQSPAIAEDSSILDVKETCYLYAYPQRETFFRDGAADYLNSLERMFPGSAAIMSNSKDTSIRKKLDGLEGLAVDLHLIGLAQKMVVVSESGQILPEGFPVPVNPDRPEYLRRLFEFLNPGAEPLRGMNPDLSDLAVIGDNFFLDLAAVLLTGGYGILLKTEATQGYEVPFLQQHPRGHFAEDFDDALRFLEENR